MKRLTWKNKYIKKSSSKEVYEQRLRAVFRKLRDGEPSSGETFFIQGKLRRVGGAERSFEGRTETKRGKYRNQS